MRKKYLVVILASLATVAALGSSLGLVAAGTRQSLSTGFNLAGGPLQADMPPADAAAMMRGCDMGRASARPLWVSQWMTGALPRERVVSRRRQHYTRYAQAFSDRSPRQQALAALPPHAAPYVYPLWVDDADRVYRRLRAIEAPVFRWDRIWPGTPEDPSDFGPRWSHHVLQLLCHQDLADDDVDRVVDTLHTLLQE